MLLDINAPPAGGRTPPHTQAVVVPEIVTPRLRLVSMPLEFMQASLEGRFDEAARLLQVQLPADWPVGAEHALGLRTAQLEVDPESQPWLLRAIVPSGPAAVMVGRIGFHAPPDARGAVEIGYAVSPPHRRRGYAGEAAVALLDWAQRTHGIRLFIASVSPTNEASLRLIDRLGFRQTGVRWDEIDGEELVFELIRD
jgi:RimJ/RimL family protein N-acetyltransferase